MKYIILIIISCFSLIGCETVPTQLTKNGRKGYARVTAYNPYEKDKIKIKRGRHYVWRWIKWGRRTASGIKAIQGITCAAAKKFPMGTKVYIPKLKGVIGNGLFEVQDRGGGESRLHTSDWFDIFCDNKYVMNKIKYEMPEWLEYQIQ